MTINIGENDVSNITIDSKDVHEVTIDNELVFRDTVKQEDINRIWDKVDKTFLETYWSENASLDPYFYSPPVDEGCNFWYYWWDINRGSSLATFNVKGRLSGTWLRNHGGSRSLYEARIYLKTDKWYHMDTAEIERYNSFRLYFQDRAYGIENPSIKDVHVRIYKKSNNKIVDSNQPDIAKDKTQIVNVKLGVPWTKTDYEVSYGVITDQYYFIGTCELDPDGSFGFFYQRPEEGILSIKIRRRATGELVLDWHESIGLVKSYDIPIDFVHTDGTNMYDLLGKRTFIYDQAVALIASTIRGDTETSAWVAQGLLDSQLDIGEWAFSYHSISMIPPDVYLRTGANFWAVYSLLFYLRTDNSIPYHIEQNIERAVRKALVRLEETYWVEDDTRVQHHTFTGGKGLYAADYSSFDANYMIEWSSTEHNIDAYETYALASELFGDQHFKDMKEDLAETLMFTLWIPSKGRAARGARLELDDCHALDVGSWFSIAAMSIGYPEIQQLALDSTDKYEVRMNHDIGFMPYHVDHCYPEATETIWFEGTWGVTLAYLAIGDTINAKFYYQRAMDLEQSNGYPYTTVAQLPYEMQSWTSLASTAWALIAADPKGFWGVENKTLIDA